MELKKLIETISKEEDADILMFSGPINRDNAEYVIKTSLDRKKRSTNIILVLSTYGGDPDAAFQIARHVRRRYETVTLLVDGFCKSAGTLISLSADKIVMSELGELGPLDVQVQKYDEIGNTGSVLEIFQSINFLSEQAIQMFDEYLVNIINRSRGAITTKTASEISTALAQGLISPIIGQIDPHRLGEMQRSISISAKYGNILDTPNIKEDTLNRLIYGYPTHSFVIDIEEAKTLFNNVSEMNDNEKLLCLSLKEYTRKPDPKGFILFLKDLLETNESNNDEEKNEESARSNNKDDDSRRNGQGKSNSKGAKSRSKVKSEKSTATEDTSN